MEQDQPSVMLLLCLAASNPIPLEDCSVHECAEIITTAQVAWPSCPVNCAHAAEDFSLNLRHILLTDCPPLSGFSYCDRSEVLAFEVQ